MTAGDQGRQASGGPQGIPGPSAGVLETRAKSTTQAQAWTPSVLSTTAYGGATAARRSREGDLLRGRSKTCVVAGGSFVGETQ